MKDQEITTTVFEKAVFKEFETVNSIIEDYLKRYPDVKRRISDLEGAIYNYKKYTFKIKQERYRFIIELSIYDKIDENIQNLSQFAHLNSYSAVAFENASKAIEWEFKESIYSTNDCINAIILTAIQRIDILSNVNEN